MSVNSVMFEELCKKDENIELNTIYDNLEYEVQKEKDIQHSPVQRELDNQAIKNDTVNIIPKLNDETLEHVCSQLSIDDGEEYNDQNSENVQQIQPHPTSASGSKSLQSHEKSYEKISNPLKHKPRELSNVNDNEETRKKTKLCETLEYLSIPSSLLIQDNSCDEMYSGTTKLQLNNEKVQSALTISSLPQIKKIETVTHPITVQLKLPMAEISPRHSSLFSPRHYKQTYTSSGNLSHYFDNNHNDPIQGIKRVFSNRSNNLICYLSEMNIHNIQYLFIYFRDL